MKLNSVYLLVFVLNIGFSACIGTYEAPGIGNACCIDDTTIASGHTDTTSQYLCLDGEIFGCQDIPNSVGTLYGECIEKENSTEKFYCLDSRWDFSNRVNTCQVACTGTWFGGDGEKGCCESGEEFVYGGVIKKDLTVYFKFDFISEFVFDNMRGLYGVLKNNPTEVTSGENVVKDTAISFDGIDDYIEIPTSPEIELDQNLTLSFWIKPNNIGPTRINPIDKSYGGEFALTIETDGSLSYYHGTSRSSSTYYWSWIALGVNKLQNGNWYFITITRDIESNEVKSYLGGLMEGQTTFSTDPNKIPSKSTFNMTIGDGYVSNFGGIIDEVMVWNRTLSDREVLILYRDFPEKTQTDIIGYWNFDETSGIVVKDSSLYSLDGTFYSDPLWTDDAKLGGALNFDADSNPDGDYISFASSPNRFNVDASTSQTMMAWIKPNQTDYTSYFLWKEGGCIGWSMYVEADGDIGCRINLGDNLCTGYVSYNIVSQNTNYVDGGWHHVACVIDRTNVNMSLFIDGVHTNSIPVDNVLSGSGGSLRIGTSWNNQAPFNGSIDEVKIIERAISKDELNYFYNLNNWNAYACDSTKVSCESGDCVKSVYDLGIPHYCSDGFFTDFRLVVDSCNDACTNQGGTWVGGGNDKNCCINSQEFWCNEVSGLDTICYEGVSSDCNSWCDAYGVVGSYTCTSSQDGDCVSSLSCLGGDCACLKANELICDNNSECLSGNCQGYSSENLDQNSLGSIYGSFPDTVCCDTQSCAYDNYGNFSVDTCAKNSSTSIDADSDGDLDYCLNSQWKECLDYVAENAYASDCGCLGSGVAINKTNVWTCRSQPVNLTYDNIVCGTSCDSDSVSNDEMINEEGYCILAKDSCSDVIKNVSWSGNDSLINVLVDTVCPCKEAATCDIWAGTSFVQTQIVSGIIPIVPSFSYGNNNISVDCSCSVREVSCQTTFPVIIDTSNKLIVNDCIGGANCSTSVNVSNLGNLPINILSKLTSTFYTETQNTQLIDKSVFTYTNTPSCNLLIPTWESKEAGTEISYSVNLSFSELSKTITISEVGKLFQCESNIDCTTCCSSGASCWLNSSNSSDFSCSDGVCCPSNEHFQNGACCSSLERCCIDDLGCNVGEWCSNQSIAPSGDFICQSQKELGQFCVESRECASGNCGSGICADPEPVVLSEWYECNPYLTNDYCSYESSSGNYTFDPVGCNLDSSCSNSYYCYLPRRACIECPTPNTFYDGLNLSDDGYCPSLSCLGSDLDCCSLDSDCELGDWCHASASCTECSDRAEGVCSSPGCFGIDPDCCNTDLECGQGLKCVANTCTGNLGEICETDTACSGGLKCLNGICAKEKFIALIPEGPTTGAVGDVIKMTLVVQDPIGRQGGYIVEVDTSFIPDSSFIYIDNLKKEEFGLSKDDAKKFLVTVYGGKNTDILGKIIVRHREFSQIQDDVVVDVSIQPTDFKNVPVAPLNSWILVIIIGYLMSMVTLG
ncbi:MAG: LamG domain-containing protein [Candidatus Altiarchaeota archaeon]|nr:LamG domain-containing protein [Candidatus Altiarchaeota archaeon]